MFGRKKPVQKLAYDLEKQYPVIRCSICNGEQVAGIKNRTTGKFEEVMLVRSDSDLETFEQMVGKTDIPKEY